MSNASQMTACITSTPLSMALIFSQKVPNQFVSEHVVMGTGLILYKQSREIHCVDQDLCLVYSYRDHPVIILASNYLAEDEMPFSSIVDQRLAFARRFQIPVKVPSLELRPGVLPRSCPQGAGGTSHCPSARHDVWALLTSSLGIT